MDHPYDFHYAKAKLIQKRLGTFAAAVYLRTRHHSIEAALWVLLGAEIR